MLQSTVLVVEDDADVGPALRVALESTGCEVILARSLRAARLLADDAELVILDRGLPDGDGLELLRQLRAAGKSTGVLVLTARDAVTDRVEGLRAGADDYLAKPFHTTELIARLEALERRTRGHAPPTAVGELRYEPGRGTFFRGDQELELTAQEHRLLRYMLSQVGRVLSRSELLEEVWHVHHDPGTNVVDVYIRYLRKKVDAPFDQPLIHTVRGRGYVLEDRSGQP